jgi:hypothetical protein
MTNPKNKNALNREIDESRDLRVVAGRVQSRRRGRAGDGSIIAAVNRLAVSIQTTILSYCDLHDAGWEANSSFPPTNCPFLLRRLEGDFHAIG